jgi:hypothetical protein
VVSRNLSYDLIDTDGERRAEALYREHVSLAGRWVPLTVRWIDVMPVEPVPTMAAQLEALRRTRAARGIRQPDQRRITDSALERRREQARTRYAREQLDLRGGLTLDEWRARQQQERLDAMTPTQRRRHEYYLTQRERVLARARQRAAERRAAKRRGEI